MKNELYVHMQMMNELTLWKNYKPIRPIVQCFLAQLHVYIV